MTKNTVLQKIKKLYPNVKSIDINYWGDSDDFEEFHSLSLDGVDEENCDDFVDITKDYMFGLFNSAKSGISFVDGGAEGLINFDLVSEEVTLYNTSLEFQYGEDGDIDWDEDKIEHDDDPEIFKI
jgi:hypothetical protein